MELRVPLGPLMRLHCLAAFKALQAMRTDQKFVVIVLAHFTFSRNCQRAQSRNSGLLHCIPRQRSCISAFVIFLSL